MSQVSWADPEGSQFFLVSWGHPNEVAMAEESAQFGLACLSDIVRKLRDDAFYDAMGEDTDIVRVWRLTHLGPVPVRVEFVHHQASGMVECRLLWRMPDERGTAANRVMSGFYESGV